MPTDKMGMGETFHLELVDKDGKLKQEIKKYTQAKKVENKKPEEEDEG